MKDIISLPVTLNPFKNPESYPNFDKKEYSEDEVFSFARFLLFETNFFGIDNQTYIGDYLRQWKKRQEIKVWD